jgi:hypothetical protein
MVLTGYLDDGTVGLQTIKKRGGITVVQDPSEAEYPSMPRIALRYVKVDHTVPIAEAGALLTRLVAEPPEPPEEFPTNAAIEIESNIAEQLMNTKELLESVEQIGERTTFTCPDCIGAIWQIGDDEPLKLRCQVGHSFTGGSSQPSRVKASRALFGQPSGSWKRKSPFWGRVPSPSDRNELCTRGERSGRSRARQPARSGTSGPVHSRRRRGMRGTCAGERARGAS